MSRATTSTGLALGTWDEAEAMVGSRLASFAGADPVSAVDIRRKLEVIALDAPIHTDEAAAQAAGYRSIVSPVSMTRVWGMPAYWEPGLERPGAIPMATPIAATSVPGQGDTLAAVEVDLEYHEYLHPGDRVSWESVLESVTRKRTRVGEGAFMVVLTTYRNQDDAVVATERATLFRFGEAEG